MPLGPSWGQLGAQKWILDPTSEATRIRVILGVAGERHFVAKGGPRIPRGADSHQKSARRGPRDVPKERKSRKKRKLRHLDFERPYGGLATFTPFGEARVRKKTNKIYITKKRTYINTQNHTKNNTKTIQNQFCIEKSEKVARGVLRKVESCDGSMPGPLIVLTILLSLGPWASGG